MTKETKFCMYCGQIISEDSKYCPLCGKSQSLDAPSEQREAVTNEAKPVLTDWTQNTQGKTNQQKKRVRLFEEKTFENVDAAQAVLDNNAAMMKRGRIGVLVAVAASIFGVLCLLRMFEVIYLPIPDAFLLVTLIGSVAAYILTGGITNALRYVQRITVMGWFLIPLFPINLFVGLFALMMTILLFLFVPIVCVGIRYAQNKRDVEDAELFIRILQQAARG